ncbi:HAD family phosphatase [Synechococcus sp. UW179A]|uniref:HAD family hydrolase n=1 Tax=Synechococcus sp. UW179A TaxID=2575510 RepID=UPI000E0EA93D|nr:HAD family phosphatase [Synechococcus sp. UW179A]
MPTSALFPLSNQLTTQPKACLFDLDGLLLDTEPLHSRAWQQAAQQFGTSLATDQLIKLQGRRRLDNARLVCSWIDRSITPEQLLAIRQPIAEQLLPEAKAIEGAESLVQTAGRLGIATALVTSSDRKSVQRKIGNHPWVNRLQLMICGDEPGLKAGKPAPDPFLMGAERLKVSPQDCWAFEDSKAGCESALAAGCLVWRLLRKTEEAYRLDPGAQKLVHAGRLFAISQLSEAQRCLESLISKAD